MTAPASIIRDLTGRRLGRYEVLAQLASGGMATVYAARAQGVAGFERLVAVKVLHPHLAHDDEFISMFLDEARLAARIRHPNVVPTPDIPDSQGDGYFLVPVPIPAVAPKQPEGKGKSAQPHAEVGNGLSVRFRQLELGARVPGTIEEESHRFRTPIRIDFRSRTG